LWLAGAVLVLFGCGPDEAAYQGKKASYWINQLTDKDATARQQAATALGQIGREAVPALTQALQDEDASTRSAAADSLAKIGEEAREAVPALKDALQDPDKAVRRQAAFALGVVADGRDPHIVPALAGALKDADREVRRQAATALGRLGPEAEAAIPALTEALKLEDPQFDWIFRGALEKIGSTTIP
jgi:HEAT repeat protein